MPETVTCTACGAKLKVPAMPPPGKKLRCPKCQEVFLPEQPADDDDDDRDEAPKPAAKPSFKSGKPQRDDDDDYDAPKKKKKKSGRRVGNFEFDGTAGDFFPVFLVAMLIQMFTFGIGGPWTICMIQKWQAEHTLINGRRLTFNGTGSSLLGLFIVSYFLVIITLGIYIFWMVPKITAWIVENTDFEDAE